MTQQHVFLDTEFTGFEDPKLISVGLVALSGEEFYAEVHHAVDECSEFVRATVLPLLNQDKRYSLTELKGDLSTWIETVRQDGPILICYDSEYDRTMLRLIFENDTPNGLVFRNLGSSYVNKLKMYEWHVKHKQPEHHALHDARALKYSFRGWLRKVR